MLDPFDLPLTPLLAGGPVSCVLDGLNDRFLPQMGLSSE